MNFMRKAGAFIVAHNVLWFGMGMVFAAWQSYKEGSPFASGALTTIGVILIVSSIWEKLSVKSGQ